MAKKKEKLPEVFKLNQVKGDIEYTPTGWPSFDFLNGGGLQTLRSEDEGDSAFIHMIASKQGMGKSTYLMQLLDRAGRDWKFKYEVNELTDTFTGIVLPEREPKVPMVSLYAANEEVLPMIRNRATRLCAESGDHVHLVEARFCEDLNPLVETVRPQILVLDSVQGLRSRKEGQRGWSRGSKKLLDYIEELCFDLKKKGVFVILVGHSTKKGTPAGTNTLQHMIDATCWIQQNSKDAIGRHVYYLKNRGATTAYEMYHKMETDGFDMGQITMRGGDE